MSCHDIGHGLNSVSESIMDLYIGKRISIEDTKLLLNKAKSAVYYCDGNEYEAIACLKYNDICSACLKSKDELYQLMDEISYNSEIYEEIDTNPYYVDTIMCKDCARKLLEEKLGKTKGKELLQKLKPNN